MLWLKNLCTFILPGDDALKATEVATELRM